MGKQNPIKGIERFNIERRLGKLEGGTQ